MISMNKLWAMCLVVVLVAVGGFLAASTSEQQPFAGDMDNFYLNLAVYRLEDFLKSTKDPHEDGWFAYGRPMRGHGWQPMTNTDLIRVMTDGITKNAPRGDDTSTWKY